MTSCKAYLLSYALICVNGGSFFTMKYYRNFEVAQAAEATSIDMMAAFLEQGFLDNDRGEVILPEKSSQIIDPATQARINCMPCTAPGMGYSGVKLVSVFPTNAEVGKPNVSGMVLLLSSNDGSPVALLDAGYLTALRTALVGGIAAKYLANPAPERIGFLGAGVEAFMHLFVMTRLFPSIRQVAVSSRKRSSEERFALAVKRKFPQLDVATCGGNYSLAAKESDIIVTAISGQVPLLKADWCDPGAFYCHVGGIEDEYGVALKADKIVCDSWGALKHRGSPTIAHMYRDGVLTDDMIYAELVDLISGRKKGRESDSEFNYFNSIGMALVDIYASAFLVGECDRMGLGLELSTPDFDAFVS